MKLPWQASVVYCKWWSWIQERFTDLSCTSVHRSEKWLHLEKFMSRISKQRDKTVMLTSSPYKKSLGDAQMNWTLKVGKVKKKMLPKGKKEDDISCLYCKELYSQHMESWVACCLCHRWAHYSCAGVDEADKNPNFVWTETFNLFF